MKILALETSAKAVSAAVAEDGQDPLLLLSGHGPDPQPHPDAHRGAYHAEHRADHGGYRCRGRGRGAGFLYRHPHRASPPPRAWPLPRTSPWWACPP